MSKMMLKCSKQTQREETEMGPDCFLMADGNVAVTQATDLRDTAYINQGRCIQYNYSTH